MTVSNIILFSKHQVRSGLPPEYPFDDLEPGCIVLLTDQPGLCESVEAAEGGQFIFRALNQEGLPLINSDPQDVRSFGLPIFYCMASRQRSQIVAVVRGEQYDVTRDNDPDVAAPLFQEVHAKALIDFMTLALDAGFAAIELSNGHEAYDVEITDLIAECYGYCADREVQPNRNRGRSAWWSRSVDQTPSRRSPLRYPLEVRSYYNRDDRQRRHADHGPDQGVHTQNTIGQRTRDGAGQQSRP